MTHPNRLALFDCDGTLVDGQHSHFLCMEEAFTLASLPVPTRSQARRVIGLSLIPTMQVLMPDADADLWLQLADNYKSAFHGLRSKGLVEEPLFDGIVAALDALKADGWLLGVATGKSDRGLALCLAHHGLADHFITLQTADRHPSKPHPSMVIQAMTDAGATPDTTVMIGDTSFDMAMGIAAGARSLGVDWGYHDAHELRTAGAYHVAAHPHQLRDAMTLKEANI